MNNIAKSDRQIDAHTQTYNTYPGKTSGHTKEYLSWFWGESGYSAVFMVMEKQGFKQI